MLRSFKIITRIRVRLNLKIRKLSILYCLSFDIIQTHQIESCSEVTFYVTRNKTFLQQPDGQLNNEYQKKVLKTFLGDLS